ncbi:Angiopoietin 4 [Branchiostoma belcheri]|nr:Angiopoietin 4 [Branchiostoma belcheri]
MEGSLRRALLAAACCLLIGTLAEAQDQTMGPALVEGHVDYSGQMSCKIIWPTPADRAKETARIAALETRVSELEKMEERLKELEGVTPRARRLMPPPPHLRLLHHPPEEPPPPSSRDPNRADCAALYKRGGQRRSGVYRIHPAGVSDSFEVYCDMETDGGGWTLIQRRIDGSVAFNRGWAEYKAGFGQASTSYWLGNDKIHHLTNSQGDYSLRIDLTSWEGESRYAKYESFKIADESDNYRLSQRGYSGNAGDTMTIGLLYGNDRQQFSTIDRDNDANRIKNCARDFGQGGWWYGSCSHTDLNGEYLGSCGIYCAYGKGVYWSKWKGWEYSLKETAMKIRPKNY